MHIYVCLYVDMLLLIIELLRPHIAIISTVDGEQVNFGENVTITSS